MATKTWTAAADFTNLTAPVTDVNDKLALRHEGAYDGSGFSSSTHPGLNEIKGGWKSFKDGNLSGADVSYSDGNAVITLKGGGNNHYYNYYAYSLGAEKVTSDGDSFQCDFDFQTNRNDFTLIGLFKTGNLEFGSGNNWGHGLRLQIAADGTPYFFVVDDSGTAQSSDSGSAGDISADTTYYGRIKSASGTVSCAVYASDANRTAESSAVFSSSYDASSDSVTVDCFAIKNHINATSTVQVTLSKVNTDFGTWVTKHKGADGSYFDLAWDTNFTYAEDNTPTGSIELSDGKLAFSLKQDGAENKRIKALMATNSAIGKTSSYDESTKINYSDLGGGQGIAGGFFADGENGINGNAICWWVGSNGSPGIWVSDGSNQTFDQGSAGDLSVDTDYWLRLRCSGTDITLDVYSSQADHDNDENQVRTVTLTQADMTTASVGTITCDRYGIHNWNSSGAVAAQTGDIIHFEGDGTAVTWWETCTARLADEDFETLADIDYSTLSATITGSVTWEIRKEETDGGGITTTSEDYTLAEIQALDDENMYSLGFDLELDPSNSNVAISDVSIDYSTDTTAPSDLDYHNVQSISGKDWWVVGWEDPTDTGGSGFAHCEMRIAESGQTAYKYIGWDGTNNQLTLEDDSANAASFRNPNHTETVDRTGYTETLDKSDLSITWDDIDVWMRGIDNQDNKGGWTKATNYTTNSSSSSVPIRSGGSIINV